LPTAPFGRAAHHGTPCPAVAAACPDADAVPGDTCPAASTLLSAPMVADPATAPVAIFTNSRRPIVDSLLPSLRFFMRTSAFLELWPPYITPLLSRGKP
jgi:hypothetical protein